MVRLHVGQALLVELPQSVIDFFWAGQLVLELVASLLLDHLEDVVNGDDGRGAQLDLHLAGVSKFCLSIDNVSKLCAVREDTAMSQNLRNSIICEDRQLLLVGELRKILNKLFKGGREVIVCSSEVSDENLCSFVEEDLTTLVDGLVSETLERVDNRLDKLWA